LSFVDRIQTHRYSFWLDAVFGAFEAWPDIDPHEVFALSPLESPGHGFEKDEICAATIQTFERSGQDLARFSDHALGCGLRVLVDTGYSDISANLHGRADVLKAFGDLYDNCLRQRSPPVLGSFNEPAEPAAKQLAHITYMLWDTSSISYWPDTRDQRIFAPVFLDMLEQVIMTNDNPACIESALHGIGHASSYRRGSDAAEFIDRRRERMIDAFLIKRSTLRPELLTYAAAARTGRIQ
jgi:hypothetical protein